MTESEMAKHVINHYEKLGYEIYKEVSLFGGGSIRADIYCVRGDETIAIETKMGLGLKVIDQSFRWRPYCNQAFICIPYKRKSDISFAKQVCQDYGIGILYFTKNKFYDSESEYSINVHLDAVKNEQPESFELHEESKNSEAGNNRSEFVTPFKLTCKRIVDYVESKNGKAGVKETIRNIKHHYKNDNSAENSLKKLVKINVIKDIKLIKEDQYYFIKETTI